LTADPIPLRIGILRLADSAPVLVAEARGVFAALGLAAEVVVEPSWANLLDKLTWGLLDAAVMLPALAVATSLGLRGTRVKLIVPMGLTSGGNSVVVGPGAPALSADPAEAARQVLGWLRAQPGRPRLAVVHLFSSHNLLLRAWLGAAGGIPERDWETVIVPPEQVVGALQAGQVAGFCAGAPWGEAAVAQAAGTVALASSALWPGQPEKALCVAEPWAEARPACLLALMRALLRACIICNEPAEAEAIARLLEGIGLPRAACRSALPGGNGREHIAFARPSAPGIWRTDQQQAVQLLETMQAAGWIPEDVPREQAARVYRPDLFLPALAAETTPASS
jgi:NitT/TauT family transport system ATP-binding protein/nitrate/nitrite transport system substrate-binding protein